MRRDRLALFPGGRGRERGRHREVDKGREEEMRMRVGSKMEQGRREIERQKNMEDKRKRGE